MLIHVYESRCLSPRLFPCTGQHTLAHIGHSICSCAALATDDDRTIHSAETRLRLCEAEHLLCANTKQYPAPARTQKKNRLNYFSRFFFFPCFICIWDEKKNEFFLLTIRYKPLWRRRRRRWLHSNGRSAHFIRTTTNRNKWITKH